MVFWFEQSPGMSLYAGMVMFTATEVLRLRTLSEVSRPFLVDWSIYNALQCELALEDLNAHYNSYFAAGSIDHVCLSARQYQKNLGRNRFVSNNRFCSSTN
jgi:hypothetical protein